MHSMQQSNHTIPFLFHHQCQTQRPSSKEEGLDPYVYQSSMKRGKGQKGEDVIGQEANV